MTHAWKVTVAPWPGVRLEVCSCGDKRLVIGTSIMQSAFETVARR